MRNYEAMVIVDARLEEGDIQKAVDRFTKVITDNGGRLGKVDRWGVRRFTFEIDHQNEGYYFVADFTAPEDAINQLKRTLLISDEFVRGKIVRPS
jgi:small subunit ribosomal protein S6